MVYQCHASFVYMSFEVLERKIKGCARHVIRGKKMKKLLFCLAIAMLSACDSSSGGGSYGGGVLCQGTIRFVNNSSNPYTVSVSGYGSFVLPGNKWTEKKYDKGSYVIQFKQNSGYLFYPTEETYTVRLGCGENATCSFPEPGLFKEQE